MINIDVEIYLGYFPFLKGKQKVLVNAVISWKTGEWVLVPSFIQFFLVDQFEQGLGT